MPDGPQATTGHPAITRSLLAWYDRHRRDLPWRSPAGVKPDPYRVWLSEIMLQQTTVTAVKPYYARFLAAWPDVEALAAAPSDEVMRQWAGLGYYARARNLQACAKVIAADHGGIFPSTEAALRSLPGIGDYTAAAVAAIAFGEAATVVDGNVERVMARLFAIEPPLPRARTLIRQRTQALVPADRPGDFAQATMDFGATLCTPKAPACGLCPIRTACRALAEGDPVAYPRRAPKTMRPQRFGAVAVVTRPDGAVLVRGRPPTGLLGGMTEFFGTDWAEASPQTVTLRRIADRGLEPRGIVDHVFTHFALRLEVFRGWSSDVAPPDNCRWVDDDRLAREPLPNLMVKVLAAARASALVPVGQDSLRLEGLEGADQQDGRQGKDHLAQTAERMGERTEGPEPQSRRNRA